LGKVKLNEEGKEKEIKEREEKEGKEEKGLGVHSTSTRGLKEGKSSLSSQVNQLGQSDELTTSSRCPNVLDGVCLVSTWKWV